MPAIDAVTAAQTSTARVSVNIRQRADGMLVCAHCSEELPGTPDTVLAWLPRCEASPAEAGPLVSGRPELYVDVEVVFRQYFCPNCWTAFHSEVVPR